jgi:peptidoglycan/xylan/chitin deacetylase (PgdA/CDA1 family)
MTNVLIYHDVAAVAERDHHGFQGATAARYKLTPDSFEAHLDAIARTGVSVGLAREKPRAALTFDDGGSSALDAARMLEAHGWRGQFFITTGRIGTRGFLSAAQVLELAASGHEVGSHSQTHPTYMAALPRAEIAREWQASRDALGELLGSAPRSAAVPGGFVSKVVIEEASNAGYELLMTSKPSATPVRSGNLVVQGRYSIWATTSARRAAAYARGDVLARSTLWLAWCAKTIPKKVSPRIYEALRDGMARHRSAR